MLNAANQNNNALNSNLANPEAGKQSSAEQGGTTVKRSRGIWNKIKKRWNRRGVIEVTPDHHRYELLNCVKCGISEIIKNNPHLGPKHDLLSEDYKHVWMKTLTSKNNIVFDFVSYASPIFASLRKAVDITEKNYMRSLASESSLFLEFISNSKSGADFFLTNDKCFMLKTEQKKNIEIFLSFLGNYLDHFLSYPHSLLVKIIGVYSITITRSKKPEPPGSQVICILKDKNFLEQTIEMGRQREWLLNQLRLDSEFLKDFGVIDYSLLVGIQRRQQDEKHEDLGDVIFRVRKSVKPAITKSSSSSVNPEERSRFRFIEWLRPRQTVPNEQMSERENSKILPGSVHYESDEETEATVSSLSSKSSSRPHFSLLHYEGGIEENQIKNRRLLPKETKNPLHVIDGTRFRYYLGIVDIFTLYECKKVLERIFVKSIHYPLQDHSTVPPKRYSKRFLQFMNDRIC